MPQYIWEQANWPDCTWDSSKLLEPLAECRREQGRLQAQLESSGFEDDLAAQAETLEEDAIQTAAIEGEKLDREMVRSSVATHLGLEQGGLRPASRATDGLVEVLLDATRNYEQPLTLERICSWHAALFPTGQSGLKRIVVGAWRAEHMEVVSGPINRPKVHYVAPRPDALEHEMASFVSWWEQSRQGLDGVLRAGLAHLRFVTIHPFDDGNGRIARTLTDLALAQDERRSVRYYSLSAQIMSRRNEYYDVLEQTQKGDGDVTEWLLWFLEQVRLSVTTAGQTMARVLLKAEFWRKHAATPLTERQRKVVNRLLDAGPEHLGGGFEGGLTNRKYSGMTKASRATAYREITDLVEKGILSQRAQKGRSVAYDLVW